MCNVKQSSEGSLKENGKTFLNCDILKKSRKQTVG